MSLSEIWAGDRSRTHTLVGHHDQVRVYAGWADSGDRPQLVVEIPRDQPLQKATVVVQTHAFRSTLGERGGFPAHTVAITIELQEARYLELFTKLCDDIVASVTDATSSREAARAVGGCLSRWRRFLQAKKRLSEEEVRGLLGELMVLARSAGLHGPGQAVEAWHGWDRALRDFEFPAAAVEVKTFQLATGATVRISSPAQLEDSPVRQVYLAAVGLAESAAGGYTLPEFVERVGALFADEPGHKGMFDDQVQAYGYHLVQASIYVKRYQFDELTLYRVGPDFPRIRVDELDDGVSDVQFSLALSTLTPFGIDPDTVIGTPFEEGQVP